MATGDPVCPYCGAFTPCLCYGRNPWWPSFVTSAPMPQPFMFVPPSTPQNWRVGPDPHGRPSWDDVYMAMAFIAAQRSMDPRTKHGCVIVSADNRPLSWGCNGPIKGINDAVVPKEAPDKYYHMLHAEKNALLAYCGSKADIEGGTAYVTGECCIKHHCLPSLIQKGIKRIVQGHVKSVMIHNAGDEEFSREQEAKRLMIEQSGIVVDNVGAKDSIRKVLADTLAYFDEKAK